MKNLKDAKTKIFPSTTRGGKELPSSSALDSPSVSSKVATPKPASAINSDMSHVIDELIHGRLAGYFLRFFLLLRKLPCLEESDGMMCPCRSLGFDGKD